MTPAQLLRLYPRAWRDRYGDEFVQTVGAERLQLQQVIDIVFGALDAWLSADVRDATSAAAHGTGGTEMMKALSVCGKNQVRYTKRDGLIGGAVMLAGSAVAALIGTVLHRNGYDTAAESVFSMGWLVAMNLSMPLWLTKGQPLKPQLAITGVTTAIVVLTIWLNA